MFDSRGTFGAHDADHEDSTRTVGTRKVVLITRHTRLTDLVSRFQTLEQAKFYVEHLGADFGDYEREHAEYVAAQRAVEAAVRRHCRLHQIDRAYAASYLFHPDDIVVTLGQDGLVANVMKYLDGQPLLGVNPSPARFDGVLLPFRPGDVGTVLADVLGKGRQAKAVTMAEAALSDGQRLLAVNDLFIGPKTHTSARYEIELGNARERQSSSGVIVSTGLGSTAWMHSVLTGTLAIARALGAQVPEGVDVPLPWDAPQLRFAVREPFPSVATQASLVCGRVARDSPLLLRSLMPENGVIFSDGMETDFVQFNSGILATIRVSAKRGALIV